MSQLYQAVRAGKAILVETNETRFLAFRDPPTQNQPTSLGVWGLGACSVVIVVSKQAVILSHIGPNVFGSEENDSFIQLARRKMDELERIYNEKRQLFTIDSEAYIVYATMGGQVVSPEQTAIFRDRLARLQLPTLVNRAYQSPREEDVNVHRPEGQVLVEKPSNSRPMVYLEDRIISPGVGVDSRSPAQASSSRQRLGNPGF